MPTLTDDSHFSIDVERGNERLDILANRPLRSVAVYSLAGHLLISGLPQDDDGRRVSLSLPRWQHSQPVIVVCEAADDAYITRKVR